HTRFSRDWSSDVCSSDLKLTRPGFKGISLPYYYPWTGNLLTEYVANDAAELGVEMTRVEFVTEANGSINFAAYDELVDRAASREIGRASCRERGQRPGAG